MALERRRPPHAHAALLNWANGVDRIRDDPPASSRRRIARSGEGRECAGSWPGDLRATRFSRDGRDADPERPAQLPRDSVPPRLQDSGWPAHPRCGRNEARESAGIRRGRARPRGRHGSLIGVDGILGPGRGRAGRDGRSRAGSSRLRSAQEVPAHSRLACRLPAQGGKVDAASRAAGAAGPPEDDRRRATRGHR
jgi:hypothetical protein